MSSRVSAVLACACSLLVAAGISTAVGSGSGDAVAKESDPGSPRAFLIECSRGKRPADRTALFAGQMEQIPGGARMRMRFDLYERIGNSKHWKGLAPPALRVWRDSDPGVKRFVYRQRVDGLKEATSYRMGVRFQWLDASGGVIATDSEESAICRQTGKLANLAFRDDVHVRPGSTAGTYRYAALIHNNGKKTSPATQLQLLVDGAEVDVRPIGRLAPGDRRRVRFVGPQCKTEVRAKLDPRDVIREIAERDNLVVVPCERAFLPE